MSTTDDVTSAPRLFTFTFGGGYSYQQTVVVATSREEAIELVTQHTSPGYGSHRFSEIARDEETNEIMVHENDGPVAFTHGLDG